MPDDELLRFIHHLCPRYDGNFQDRTFVQFVTYEASTSLNMHMVGSGSKSGETSLKKAIRDGVLINEVAILCKIITKDIDDYTAMDRKNKRRELSLSLGLSSLFRVDR